jgi:hypothetical protein
MVAGISPSEGQHRQRTIVWAGDVLRVMSFAEAWRQLQGPRYAELRGAKYSPLHLKPIGTRKSLKGYKHRSKEHSEPTASGYSGWDDLGDGQSRFRWSMLLRNPSG